ncbi:DUF3263 domain-containing protein [Gordonia crocea]|uniref:DUF3263 domain-containing protein n=1 Tax=Gordonia crocea TaxID=589162 RepID=A0A7M3SUW5_9ACTN|nr:DUF3263 domain-containing protein [Gordonia crocea]GED96439.1 hypothetical protein nbrc107697_04780 [Gordonia crocea]
MTDEDRALLDFADRWWRTAGAQHDAITRELGMTPTRYFQRLNALLDDPAALAHNPALVRRLQRVRAQRDTGRTARRTLG